MDGSQQMTSFVGLQARINIDVDTNIVSEWGEGGLIVSNLDHVERSIGELYIRLCLVSYKSADHICRRSGALGPDVKSQ